MTNHLNPEEELCARFVEAAQQLQQQEAYRRFFERQPPTEEGEEANINHYYVLSKDGPTYRFYPYKTLPQSLQEKLWALFEEIFHPEDPPSKSPAL